MYEISSDWIRSVDETRQATTDKDGEIITPCGVIEPDHLFSSRTIGIYASSASSDPNWYRAGTLYQAHLVGFGQGYAQGEEVRLVLNRYRIYNFTQSPYLEGESRYLISFVPIRGREKAYLKDIRLQIWEYRGTSQGVSNEDLLTQIHSIGSQIRKVSSQNNSIEEAVRRLKRSKE
jgi:hypothetical protein